MKEVAFEELCDRIADAELRAAVVSIGDFIYELAQTDRSSEETKETFDLLRDALFSVTEDARSLQATEKMQQMKDALVQVQRLVAHYQEKRVPREEWRHKVHGLVNTTFSPLTMHVLTQTRSGQPYILRTKIPPSTVVFEEPRRYRTTWQFDKFRFSSKKARDVALVLELAGRDPEECISGRRENGSTIVEPVFEIDDEKYTTNEELRAQRPDLKGIYSVVAFARKLGLDDADITFLQQYIQEAGKVA